MNKIINKFLLARDEPLFTYSAYGHLSKTNKEFRK